MPIVVLLNSCRVALQQWSLRRAMVLCGRGRRWLCPGVLLWHAEGCCGPRLGGFSVPLLVEAELRCALACALGGTKWPPSPGPHGFLAPVTQLNGWRMGWPCLEKEKAQVLLSPSIAVTSRGATSIERRVVSPLSVCPAWLCPKSGTQGLSVGVTWAHMA